jgi:DNA-binding XRE family transcriptional regulator
VTKQNQAAELLRSPYISGRNFNFPRVISWSCRARNSGITSPQSLTATLLIPSLLAVRVIPRSRGGVRFEEVEDVLLEHIPMLSMAYRESKNNLPTGDYPDAMETMGDRIRLLRQSKGLTQEQLGDRLGVSKVAVSQWETGGTSNVRLKTFLALVEELGTTPHYLIFGPDNRSHAQKRRTGP